MQVHEWEAYLEEVTRYVRFKPDHADIRLELRAHLEDRTEDLKEEGYTQEEAQQKALLAMGDARAVGEALDQEHSPVLGWIWWSLRACRIAMVILLLPTVLNLLLMTGMTFANVLQGYAFLQEEDYGNVRMTVKPDAKGRIDDVHIVIDEVRRYENHAVQICYRTWNDPFSTSQQWTFSLRGCYYTENSQERFYGGGSSSGGWVSYHEDRLENFPEDSETLIIDYDYNGRRFYVQIPLTGEKTMQNTTAQEGTL